MCRCRTDGSSASWTCRATSASSRTCWRASAMWTMPCWWWPPTTASCRRPSSTWKSSISSALRRPPSRSPKSTRLGRTAARRWRRKSAPCSVTRALLWRMCSTPPSTPTKAWRRCALASPLWRRPLWRRRVWIAAGPNHATQRSEVELRLFGRERPLRHWAPAHLHIGAEDLTCRVALLAAKAVQPGETALAALHLDRPIAAWTMQKFILRDQSAQRTLGGGVVLDPLPPAYPLSTLPRLRGRVGRGMRLARLDALRAPDAATAFARMLAASLRGFDFDNFTQSCNLTAPECEALAAAHPVKICHDGNAKIILRTDHWNALRNQIVEVLEAHHRKHPELLGLSETRIHAALRPLVAKSLLRRAIMELCEAGILARSGVIVNSLGHRAQPTPAGAAC